MVPCDSNSVINFLTLLLVAKKQNNNKKITDSCSAKNGLIVSNKTYKKGKEYSESLKQLEQRSRVSRAEGLKEVCIHTYATRAIMHANMYAHPQ